MKKSDKNAAESEVLKSWGTTKQMRATVIDSELDRQKIIMSGGGLLCNDHHQIPIWSGLLENLIWTNT